jgi:hypothetical protein
MKSRIAHHIDFPDYATDELLQIAAAACSRQNYRFDDSARANRPSPNTSALRRQQPHFANARSVRNALDRIRLRQATRLFADRDRVSTPRT